TLICEYAVFFFSSRRRHTRLVSDWSSDVCSSDLSRQWEEMGVEIAYSLDEILPRCDVLNLLRIQFERQSTRLFPSVREYALLYAMNRERLAKAKKDILILAPGPINRGVEVTPDVADGPHSVILDQVTNGLAVRMAVLWLILGSAEKFETPPS